ncbi:hypothetical protein U6V27_12315, partial [Cutibacterium acnes]
LAAEVLTQRGELTLPSPLRQRARRRLATPAAGGDGGFSSRIDVDDYDAFELLHPAYARQGKVCKTFLPDCRDGTIAT